MSRNRYGVIGVALGLVAVIGYTIWIAVWVGDDDDEVGQDIITTTTSEHESGDTEEVATTDDPDHFVLMIDSGGPYPPACEATTMWHRDTLLGPTMSGTFRFDDCPAPVYDIFANDLGLTLAVDDQGCLTVTRAGIALRASHFESVSDSEFPRPPVVTAASESTAEPAKVAACRTEPFA